ncbi:DUF397 domain-containing protein [Streptomyces sp. 2BBP-J2]|nr:DUF397 domain-containing protein [Streptomyces sp. 2BBP-J2]
MWRVKQRDWPCRHLVDRGRRFRVSRAWFESSYSGSAEQAVHVQDSKDVTRPFFAVGREGRGRFVRFASEC